MAAFAYTDNKENDQSLESQTSNTVSNEGLLSDPRVRVNYNFINKQLEISVNLKLINNLNINKKESI